MSNSSPSLVQSNVQGVDFVFLPSQEEQQRQLELNSVKFRVIFNMPDFDWILSNSTPTWNSTLTNLKKLRLVRVGVGLCFHMSRKKTPSTLQESLVHNNPHLASSRRNGTTCLKSGECLVVSSGCLEGVSGVSERCLEDV